MSAWAFYRPPLRFYTGTTATQPQSASVLPIGIGGHRYVALTGKGGLTRAMLDVTRVQADTSGEPGETSLNPEVIWPRSQGDWSLGAGQVYADGEGSDRRRFYASRGVDPWTRHQLTLLHDVADKRNSVEPLQIVAAVGDYLYVAAGEQLYFTLHPEATSPTWTSANLDNVADITSITSDGATVWAAAGTAGVLSTGRAATTGAQFTVTEATLVAYVKGRLLAANGPDLFELGADGAANDLWSHSSASFEWDTITAGSGCVYAAGHQGGMGEVYRIGIDPDTGALTVPIVATQLPVGEWVQVAYGYIGMIVLGTNLGIRLAVPDSNGELTYGDLVSIPGGVTDLDGQGRFVWFTWSNPDSDHTGLGRLSLSDFLPDAPLTPAYATDLLALAQGTVTSVCSLAGRRYFAVDGDGVYGETDELVADGWLDTGPFRWTTTERKGFVDIEVRHRALDGSVLVETSLDDGEWDSAGHSTGPGSAGSPSYRLAAYGETLGVRLTLLRDTDPLLGPAVTRWTVRAVPVPRPVEVVTIPIILGDPAVNLHGFEADCDPWTEYRFLRKLRDEGAVVAYSEGPHTEAGVVTKVGYQADSFGNAGEWFAQLTCVVELVIV